MLHFPVRLARVSRPGSWCSPFAGRLKALEPTLSSAALALAGPPWLACPGPGPFEQAAHLRFRGLDKAFVTDRDLSGAGRVA